MNSDLYHVEEVNSNNISEWNELCHNSREYSPFIRDDYLDMVGYDTVKYMVKRKGMPYAGICIPINKNDGMPSFSVPFAPHQGLVYCNEGDCYSNYHNNLESTEILIDYLYSNSRIRKLIFSNSYYIKDIRAIQWHHYHNPELGVYDVTIRYTSIKKIDNDIRRNISKNRKRDYKNASEKYGIVCSKSYDTNDFIKLYRKTFLRQNIQLSEDNIEMVDRLASFIINSKLGELWYAIDQNGNRVDATIFLYLNSTGYYLFGANDPDYRHYGGATKLFLDQMELMHEKDVSFFDFVGINSPNRGDFKLSFGGDIRPYYVCSVNYEENR